MKFKYLRPEDIRNLQRYAFAPRGMVEGRFAGRHRSLAAGSSTEFRDYRPYAPGDDLRRVDWRVYARTDRYYLRTHNQETNTVCHIFLDSSGSMGFGSPLTKLDYASFFAAALAHLVLRSSDAVSLQTYDRGVRRVLAPGTTTAHLHNLLRALEENRPGEPTALSSALRHCFPLLGRKGALVVLSDFFDDPPAIFAALSPYLHRGFEVHLFHILAPEDLELPDRGLATFRDLETGGRVIAHAPSIRHAYREAMGGHIRNLRELAIRRRVHYRVTRTDEPQAALFDELVQ